MVRLYCILWLFSFADEDFLVDVAPFAKYDFGHVCLYESCAVAAELDDGGGDGKGGYLDALGGEQCREPYGNQVQCERKPEPRTDCECEYNQGHSTDDRYCRQPMYEFHRAEI